MPPSTAPFSARSDVPKKTDPAAVAPPNVVIVGSFPESFASSEAFVGCCSGRGSPRSTKPPRLAHPWRFFVVGVLR
jgi:hypothetical protein